MWLLLSHQHRLRHRLPQRQHAPDTPYHDLLKQLTAQQHAILVDLGVQTVKGVMKEGKAAEIGCLCILRPVGVGVVVWLSLLLLVEGEVYLNVCLCVSGRTFPTHQYFSAQLGAGQLSLYNLLKAYSLLDTEVHFPLECIRHAECQQIWSLHFVFRIS